MRLIDADRVTENLQSFVDWCRDGRRQGAEFCLDCVIPNTPTIDAVPVRHGKWITEECCPGVAVCSICGHEIRGVGCQYTKYCDECGARMDEE